MQIQSKLQIPQFFQLYSCKMQLDRSGVPSCVLIVFRLPTDLRLDLSLAGTIILFNKNIGVESPLINHHYPCSRAVGETLGTKVGKRVFKYLIIRLEKSIIFSSHIAIPCWGC